MNAEPPGPRARRSRAVVFLLIALALFALNYQFNSQDASAHFSQISPYRVLLGFLLALVAFVIEGVAVGWKRCSARKLLRPNASQRRDLAIYLFDLSTIWLLLGKILTVGLLFYLGAKIGGRVGRLSPDKVLPLIPSLVAQTIVLIFAVELLNYWLHRAFHKIPALWELHKYHHSATDFCILTARRDHPLVVPFFIVFAGIPAGLLGSPAEEVVWLTVIITVHAMLIHSELGGSWGLLGRWLVVSPRGHRIHHSMLPEHIDKNFGFFTPLWDRVFGTFHLPDRVEGEVIPIGVDDPIYNAEPLHEELAWGAVQAGRRLLPGSKAADG